MADDIVIQPKRIVKDVWMFQDICNVYLFKIGEVGLAFDYGSGKWTKFLAELGIKRLEMVVLTHHHADQCIGIPPGHHRSFLVRAPTPERRFLEPYEVKNHLNELYKNHYTPYQLNAVLPSGITNILFDIVPNMEFWVGNLCFRTVHTPGHGENACSYIVEIHNAQLCICGDAVYAGGTIWQPYHLEWDHYSDAGAVAALSGIRKLSGIGIDQLLPAHGPLIKENVNEILNTLKNRLQKFVEAKGSVAPGEKDHIIIPKEVQGAVRKYLDHLYQIGSNSYIIVAENGDALCIDVNNNDVNAIVSFLQKNKLRLTAILVTHPHYDHTDGIVGLRSFFADARAYFHPIVKEKMATAPADNFPYQLNHPIEPDDLLPEHGIWRWNEYEFLVEHSPGQTYYSASYFVEIDGENVAFTGDNFQPVSRWNGSGGFCAANYSLLKEGYKVSAEMILDLKPDIIAGGHRSVFRFTERRFQKIIEWSEMAEEALKALCPGGDLDKDYYLPVRHHVVPGIIIQQPRKFSDHRDAHSDYHKAPRSNWQREDSYSEDRGEQYSDYNAYGRKKVYNRRYNRNSY